MAARWSYLLPTQMIGETRLFLASYHDDVMVITIDSSCCLSGTVTAQLQSDNSVIKRFCAVGIATSSYRTLLIYSRWLPHQASQLLCHGRLSLQPTHRAKSTKRGPLLLSRRRCSSRQHELLSTYVPSSTAAARCTGRSWIS